MSRSVDLTVNIRGNSSGLREALDDATRTTSPPPSRVSDGGGSSYTTPSGTAPRGEDYSTGQAGGINVGSMVPSANRMVEDARREMQQRGVLMVPGSASMQQIISQYAQNAKNNVSSRIDTVTEKRREALKDRYSQAYDDVDAHVEARRRDIIGSDPPRYADKNELSRLDAELEQLRERLYQDVSSNLDKEEADIETKDAIARQQAEKELTSAIQKLVDHFERKSETDGGSYMSELRERQAELLDKRENAKTKEEALEYSRQLREVDKELKDAERGEAENDKDGRIFDPYTVAVRGVSSLGQGIASGSPGAIVGGLGHTAVGLSGATGANAAKGGAFVELARWIAETTNTGSVMFDDIALLSAMKGTAPSLSPRERSQGMIDSGWLETAAGHGVDGIDFISRSIQTAKGRRIASEDWGDQTLKQIYLERSMALDSGRLAESGKFDRYGVNITDALVDLVEVLKDIRGSGVSEGDFSKIEEKLAIQQGVMEGYKMIRDTPDYNQANRLVNAFSASGVQQDDRLGSDIKAMQDMIRNPVSERANQILYDVITELHPETQGRIHKIDEIKSTGKDDPRLMQAYIKRLTAEYGSMDTETGYFAIKEATKGMIPVDRLRKYVDAMNNGQMGDILKGGGYSDSAVTSNRDGARQQYERESLDYLSSMTMAMGEARTLLQSIVGSIGSFLGSASSTPKNGQSSTLGIRNGRR